MARKRCKLSRKEYEEKEHSNDRFICSKCKRTAKDKKKLCKPEKMENA